MNCDDLMDLVRATVRNRYPGSEVEATIERCDVKDARPPWLAGAEPRGWVAAITVHSTRRAVVRIEGRGATKGWAAGELARAMGVEWSG